MSTNGPRVTTGMRKVQRAVARTPRPARVVLGGFAVATAVGAGLLLLPISAQGRQATIVEALFTAASAVSVTGHVIVDTATFWSPFGQVVILLLMQLGGLGVMTFATVVGLLVVRKMSLSTRLSTQAESHALGLHDLGRVVRGAVLISLAIEGLVALALTIWLPLRYGTPIGDALWIGVFHGVSSFNNAGFTLFEHNVVDYVDDPVVNLVLCAGVVLGGLGFPVIVQLRKALGTPRLWSMNTRIVLAATPVLIVLGAAYIAVVEWDNPATLGALEPGSRILAAVFQSVQTRSGGFNSVDIGELHDTTLLGMDVLMFIGTGPAGTGGGLKVTTFAVLFFILLAEVRGDGVVNVFGKRLSRAVHRQAIAVALVSIAIVVGGTGAVMLMSGLPLGPVLFEVISAFGTTGLSTGITSDLPESAQILLAVMMFLGRLGPITFATALALRQRAVPYYYPKERPIIG